VYKYKREHVNINLKYNTQIIEFTEGVSGSLKKIDDSISALIKMANAKKAQWTDQVQEV
jgi:uncharacterized protein YkvS